MMADAFPMEELRQFIEHEAELLDEQRFDEWQALYTDDAVYWAPAAHGQESWLNHVSLFYDERHIIRTRVERLKHPLLHCQDPKSHCVRLVSNFRLLETSAGGSECRVRSNFIMLEDRPGTPQRIFGGRYIHTRRREAAGLRIALKRVDLTNCDQSFPTLTQPF